MTCPPSCYSLFFFNDTATTEIYTFPYTTLFRSGRLEHAARHVARQGQPCGLQLQALAFFAGHQSLHLAAVAAEDIGRVVDAQLGRVVAVEGFAAVERRRHRLARVLARAVVAQLPGGIEEAGLGDDVLPGGAQ